MDLVRESAHQAGPGAAPCGEGGWVMLRGVKTVAWEDGDQYVSRNFCGFLALVLLCRVVPAADAATPLLAECDARPVRLDATYTHARPRREQREHVGFSLVHLSFELAQPVQLSLSLRGA